MNLWECSEPGCHARAMGEGGGIGLRAIGWYFQTGKPGYAPSILCPRHRIDRVSCRDRGEVGNMGQPCAECAAGKDAEILQRLIGIALDVPGLWSGTHVATLDVRPVTVPMAERMTLEQFARACAETPEKTSRTIADSGADPGDRALERIATALECLALDTGNGSIGIEETAKVRRALLDRIVRGVVMVEGTKGG